MGVKCEHWQTLARRYLLTTEFFRSIHYTHNNNELSRTEQAICQQTLSVYRMRAVFLLGNLVEMGLGYWVILHEILIWSNSIFRSTPNTKRSQRLSQCTESTTENSSCRRARIQRRSNLRCLATEFWRWRRHCRS